MDISVRGYCMILLLLTLSIEASSSNNELFPEHTREPRVSGRIVKLYTGSKPEPVQCAGEGFQSDAHDCAVFYRCVKAGNGKYTVFRFQCGPGTVYDPDVEICNHPRSTKRSECGGLLGSSINNIQANEIEEQHELPSPIHTKKPVYTEWTSTSKDYSTAQPWVFSSERPSVTTLYPFVITTQTRPPKTSSISTAYTISTPTKRPGSKATSVSTAHPFTMITKSSYLTEVTKSTLIPKITSSVPRQPSLQSGELCTSDGFVGDSENCHKFYRCVSNQRGGFIRYEFSCSESTVWDDDIQGCNHPWAVKRSKCGRSLSFDDNTASNTTQSAIDISRTEKEEIATQSLPSATRAQSMPFGAKLNTTIQQQLQISYGQKVIQSQTQIGKGHVIQNQTQINFGDRINQTKNSGAYQNQTQISYGPAISQTQTQIDHGHMGVQTQVQIDHSNGSSQTQTQIYESSSKRTTTSNQYNSTHINKVENNECTENGFMGDFDDCKRFYRCVDNGRGSFTRYEYFCGEGTVWDSNIEACNHAWAVKECGGKLSTEKPIVTTSTAKSTQNYYATSASSNTEDIDEVGYGHDGHQHSTPFSTTTDKSTTTEVSQGDVSECTSSGFMGDTNNCKIFYRCVENGKGFTKYEFKCGEGTLWDPDIEACNHAWAVKKCGGSSSIHTDQENTTTSKENIASSTHVQTSISFIQSTTIGMQNDDYDTGYGSHNNELQSTINTTKEPQYHENDNGDECKSSGFMGDKKDCKKFYRCVDNGNGGFIKYEFTCGEGTLWDPKIEACNHAWAVESCGRNEIPLEHQQTTSQPKPMTTFGENSSAFTTENYNNTKKPVHSSTISIVTTTSMPIENSKCRSSGFMGDNKDCKKFYRCVDNGDGSYTRYEFSCGEGTVWDPKIEACNHAWAVEKCGGNDVNNLPYEHQITTQSVNDEDNGYGIQNSIGPDRTTPSSTSSSSSGNEISTVSNNNNKCVESGFWGDKNDCRKFYRCVDDGKGGFLKYEFSCGEGTYWNQEIQACDHALSDIQCGEKETKPTTKEPQYVLDENDPDATIKTSTSSTIASFPISSSQKPQTSQDTCNSEGFYGDSTDCKRFYRCVDNGKGSYTKYDFTCGDGTIWDQEIQACNYESNDNKCLNTATSTQKNEPQSENDKYTSTLSTPMHEQHSTVKPETSSSLPNDRCPSEGFHANAHDCTKFIRCVSNGKGGYIKYDFSCGEGTVWVQEIQACDHAFSDTHCDEKGTQPTTKEPQYVNDEMDTDTTTKTLTSSTIASFPMSSSQKPQTSQDTCESEGFYGDSTDCKRFYRCVDNGKGSYTKYDFTCGDGTIWDQEIQACNHESNDNKCSNTATTTQKNEPQSENDKYTSTLSTPTHEQHSSEKPETSSSLPNDRCPSEGFHANAHDCTKFIRCVSNGKGGYIKYDFSCGEGTVWVQEIQACDHDNGITSCNAHIQSTTKPEFIDENHYSSSEFSILSSASSSSTTPIGEHDEYNENYNESSVSDTEECFEEGYYANKNDCRRFYRCVENGHGKYTKYDFVCGEGTAWDADIQACNHISEVKSCLEQEESQTKPIMQDEESEITDSTSTTKTTTSSATDGSSSPNKDVCDKEGYYGNSRDCKKFYRCVDNGKGGFTKYDYTCGDGTIWDQDITACNHPQDVKNPSCSQNQGESETSSSSSLTTSSSSQSSTTESSNQSPSNCSQEESSNKPESNNFTCSKAGFYANPNDCKKFYRCVDWDGDGQRFSIYHFDCGEGTIWDPAVETCNHEDSVYPPRECSGTQSQNENMGQEPTTTETITTAGTTTLQTGASEQSTTQQSTTNEQETDQQSTNSEPSTTQQSTTSEQTTSQQSTTNGQTTNQQSTISEQTTTQQSTVSEQTTSQQSTTSEQTTTQQSSISEQTTTQQSTASEQTTTEQSTTSEQTTTQQSTTSEQTTTQQSTTSEESTTQQSTTSEQTTTQQSTASEETTTQQSTTSEQTATQQSTTSEQTTTQQATASENSTTQESTTGTEETTQLSTTDQSTTTEESTSESSTTEPSTSTTENGQATTTEENSSSEKECPNMDDDQYAFVCPTSFRRHPKYCNLFYQCTEDDDNHEVKIAIFNCPNNTIYDESKTQCVEENKADKKCSGEIAMRRRVKRLNAAYKEPIMVSKEKQKCVAVGHFPFEKDAECSPGFLKCERSKSGKLRGYVYQCPEGYVYWTISKRCELIDNVKYCKRSTNNNWIGRWEIPIERKNIAKKNAK